METLVAESETAPKIELFQVVVENPESEEEVCLMNQVLVENEEEDEEIQMVVESANTPDTGICLTNKAFSEEDNNSESCSPVKITDLLSLTPPPPPSSSTSVAALLVPAPPSSTLVPAPAPPPPPSSITSSSAAVVPVSSSSTSSTGDVKKALYKFGQRTSNFRGVTRHRWTGKFEAHLWDNTSISETRKRKGKQVYLGGYETEEKAAVAYDLAALKFWGAAAHSKLNFPISKYEKEIEEMIDMSKEEYINSLRRQSICFARGNSNYRGVTRQHEGRRWQARIGRVAGGRDIYLGTYDTEEEAAEAYDIAAVKLRGMGAITNFHISNYYKEGSKELDILPISAEEEQRPPPPPVRIRRFKITTA